MISNTQIKHYDLLESFITTHIESRYKPIAKGFIPYLSDKINKLAQQLIADLVQVIKKKGEANTSFRHKFSQHIMTSPAGFALIQQIILDDYQLVLTQQQKIRKNATLDILGPIFNCCCYQHDLYIRWAPDNEYLSQSFSVTPSSLLFQYHPQKTLQDYWQAALTQCHTDIIFRVEKNELYAHQSILQIRSEYFRTLLQHPFKEKEEGIVQVNDCSYEVFKNFLEFIYTGNIKDLSEEIQTSIDLFKLGHLYQEDALIVRCIDKINAWLLENTIDNHFDAIFELGSTYQIPDFINACLQGIEKNRKYLKRLSHLINRENLSIPIKMAQQTKNLEVKNQLLVITEKYLAKI